MLLFKEHKKDAKKADASVRLLPGSAGVCANCGTFGWETLTIPTSQLVAGEHSLFEVQESEVIRTLYITYIPASQPD